jgi:hypothetical protein
MYARRFPLLIRLPALVALPCKETSCCVAKALVENNNIAIAIVVAIFCKKNSPKLFLLLLGGLFFYR